MEKDKVIEYYKSNKKDIDLVKEHGNKISRCMAKAIEKYVKENTEEGK